MDRTAPTPTVRWYAPSENPTGNRLWLVATTDPDGTPRSGEGATPDAAVADLARTCEWARSFAASIDQSEAWAEGRRARDRQPDCGCGGTRGTHQPGCPRMADLLRD